MLINIDAFSKESFLKLQDYHPGIWLVPILLTCSLLPTLLLSMALFHTLVELFAIVIALMSFFVAWNTFPLSRNNTFLFLGCGYFWVGILDLLHTLTFEGVALIPGLGIGSTIQYWILSRYFEALVLLCAIFAGKYNIRPLSIMLAMSLVTILAVYEQVNQWLPVMFIPGEGLTSAKIVSEYLIILILCCAAIGFYRKPQSVGSDNAKLIILSIVFTILAELNFTLYTGFKELPLVLGHVFKLFSFWMIYRVLVESSLLMPVRSLSQIVESYDASTDETLIIDQNGQIIRANRKLRAKHGDQIAGSHCHAVLHDTRLSLETCPQCQAIRDQQTLQGYEYFCPLDQEWYESTLSGIHFGERFSAMIHSRRCITARKKADFQLARINRLYRVLSHTNKAIVSIKEVDALFREICEIAVTQGEFKMAWIGIIDGFLVRPDYYAGQETGYLKEMQMRVDDSALAKGPVGRAAKTQQVACVNSVDTDPDFEPWREAAQKRGYKALAAVPIKAENMVFGIFTLYSGHEGVFDEAMLSLLSNLSDDICAAYRHILLSQQKKESDATIVKLSSAVEQGMNAILISNAQGVIEYVNAGFVHLSGYASQEVTGMSQYAFKNAISSEHVFQDILSHLEKNGRWQGEVQNLHKDGSSFWTILSVSRLLNEVGEVTHYLWSSVDNTQLHEAREMINKLAFYDSLTGLANRRLLLDRLDRALMAAKRHGESVAIMMFDLDNFKTINDSLGHDAGDQLLKHVSLQMKSVIREDDLVARLGGDEFVIVLDGIAKSGEIIDIAGALLARIEQPVELLGNQVAISSSLGVAIYPDDGVLASELLRNADLAMYHAKGNGKNRFQFYQSEMNDKAQGRLMLEQRLRKAIAQNDFELWYQPQVAIADGQVIGFEALLRWRESGTLVPPNTFIPLAEETGMIEPIGDWVLQQAYQDWQTLRSHFKACSMAVNVSAYQFRKSEHLYQVVKTLMDKNGSISNNDFIIELTETTLIQDVAATIATLNRLKSLGLSLSIDDFGTGYSSLSRLKQFPIDQLKIDRSFIMDLLNDENDKAIVSAIIAIAQELGLKLVAEGVEQEEQAQFLKEHGCNYAQGYHYFKPMTLAQLINLNGVSPA